VNDGGRDWQSTGQRSATGTMVDAASQGCTASAVMIREHRPQGGLRCLPSSAQRVRYQNRQSPVRGYGTSLTAAKTPGCARCELLRKRAQRLGTSLLTLGTSTCMPASVRTRHRRQKKSMRQQPCLGSRGEIETGTLAAGQRSFSEDTSTARHKYCTAERHQRARGGDRGNSEPLVGWRVPSRIVPSGALLMVVVVAGASAFLMH